MAVRSKVGLSGDGFIEGKPKKSRQGSGKHTKYAATSRNGKKENVSWTRTIIYKCSFIVTIWHV